MITLIDYGSGNIHAICNIYKRLNIPYIITSRKEDLESAEKLILPGVGDFDETMLLFHKLDIKNVLDDVVMNKKIPIMGVCVGMQVLGKSSDEGQQKGFGWIDGEIKKIDSSKLSQKPYLPHMGWNEVIPRKQNKLFENIDISEGFYFLHSYYFDCHNDIDILAETDYGVRFASAVNNDNIYGVQFHPEKSHLNGIQIFKNFANL